MPKTLIFVFAIVTGISLESCGSSQKSDFAIKDAGYLIEKIGSSPGSIDISASYYYVSDFYSLSDPDSYINLIFDCDLPIAACCRDLEQNKQEEDLKADIFFSKNPEKCLRPAILNKQTPISIEKKEVIEFNIFKVKADYCKCSGSYTSLSKYKDYVFVIPYKLEFLTFEKDEIKEVKKQLK